MSVFCTSLSSKRGKQTTTILHLDTAKLCHKVPKSNSNIKSVAKIGCNQSVLLYDNHIQKLTQWSPLQKMRILCRVCFKIIFKKSGSCSKAGPLILLSYLMVMAKQRWAWVSLLIRARKCCFFFLRFFFKNHNPYCLWSMTKTHFIKHYLFLTCTHSYFLFHST